LEDSRKAKPTPASHRESEKVIKQAPLGIKIARHSHSNAPKVSSIVN
jgi:hypothetical protein